MALFLGEFEHQIDDKLRLSIPARFREQCLKEADATLAVIAGFDPCLYIVPARSMDDLRNLLSLQRTEWSETARAFRLKLVSYGSTVTTDAQGRVLISEKQREFAGLERKAIAMVVGNLDRIEVWNPERYQQHLGKPEAMDMRDLASRILRPDFPDSGER